MRTLLLLLSACVPKGRYELTHVQLDATRTALSARTGQAIVDASAAEAQRVALEEEIALRQAQLDELVARAAVRDSELERVQRERLELLDLLAQLRSELEIARQAPPKRGKTPPSPPELAAPELLAREEVQALVQAHIQIGLVQERLLAANTGTRAAFADLAEAGKVELVEAEPGEVEEVIVRIRTRLLFQEGFSTLSPRGRALVAEVSAALRRIPGRWVTIEGHTDDRKVHTAEFPSNWERAFSNALALLRGIEGAGVDARLSAASFAETRPLAGNDSPEGRDRNERIELRIALDPELATRYPPTPPPEPEPEPAGDDPAPSPEVPEPAPPAP